MLRGEIGAGGWRRQAGTRGAPGWRAPPGRGAAPSQGRETSSGCGEWTRTRWAHRTWPCEPLRPPAKPRGMRSLLRSILVAGILPDISRRDADASSWTGRRAEKPQRSASSPRRGGARCAARTRCRRCRSSSGARTSPRMSARIAGARGLARPPRPEARGRDDQDQMLLALVHSRGPEIEAVLAGCSRHTCSDDENQ